MKRPTQADVAKLANVSRATVSYVVNNLQDNQVSDETRQRVLEAIESLGYQPDATAQSLRLGMTNTIGLLIPDMDNPHYWHIAKGVEKEAQIQNYDLLLISASLDARRELHSVRALSRRRVDGLILILSFVDSQGNDVGHLLKQKVPLVLMSARVPDADSIIISDLSGTLEAMQHLLTLGHQRIGFVYGVAHQGMGSQRLEGYRSALNEAGLKVEESLIAYCGTTLQDGYDAARQLLGYRPRPTALLVINDLLALGALRAAADLSLRVPEDVSISSFDDISMALYTNPRLTTVSINASALGQIAARMIFNRLRNPQLPSQCVHVQSSLIIRDSTRQAPSKPE
jgi:LacI family transcriptional regulator